MPSGKETTIDASSNQLIWDEGLTKVVKKKYLPPEAHSILKSRTLYEKYRKLANYNLDTNPHTE